MSGWDCTICTFYNKNSSFKCKMCGASRGTSTRQARLPDQPVMQLEPPAKRAKFSKSRVAPSGKTVAVKQSKSVSHSSSSSSAAVAPGTSGTNGHCMQTESVNAASSSGISHKITNEVERVIVEQPVLNNCDIRSGRYVEPCVPVEMVRNMRLFPTNSDVYITPHITGVNSLRMPTVMSIPMYGTSMAPAETSQQSVKAKGKGTAPYSHSSKEKGPYKAKILANKGKRSYQKNKDGQVLLNDASPSKLFTKKSMRTPSSKCGESSKQCAESSRPHSSQQTWPTLPNLDYSSGKRVQVTYNNETVFITQYKLLK